MSEDEVKEEANKNSEESIQKPVQEPSLEPNQEVVHAVSQDSKNMALLCWIGTIFFGFIPGLVLYLMKKDEDPFITSHAKEALNWSITALIGYFAASILIVVLIGLLLMPVVGICHLVFCILGAVKASDSKEYTVPFTLRLIK